MHSTLQQLVDNSRTDKNTIHSYLGLYEELLQSKKYTAKNVLEIGICYGGSIKLWSDYFVNATIYGCDIMHINNVWDVIKNNDKIKLYTSTDAYNHTFILNELFLKPVRFDMILDDGPHTLESMKTYVKYYSQLLTDDGILILEDIQSWDWIDIIKAEIPQELQKFVSTFDLRPNKNRYDDIVLVINKSKNI